MIETKLGECVQWEMDGRHYVGRWVLDEMGVEIRHWARTGCVLIKRECGGPQVFVRESLLHPYPETEIEQP